MKHRVFLAGATGLIGRQLVPLLLADGHEVAGMTRTPANADVLSQQGAVPVVCDVYDAAALEEAVLDFGPDLVMHQLTDLPDRAGDIADFRPRNDRIRTEGTSNLLAAAAKAGADRFLAQSIAWTPPPPGGEAVAAHERQVLGAGGVVLRYGTFYGPGSYYEADPPSSPRIHVHEAAVRTVAALDLPSGVYAVTDDRSDLVAVDDLTG